MFLSECNSKELLAQYGLSVPEGRTAHSAEEARQRCKDIDTRKFVVKAQILAGGRGPAGGIKFAATPSLVAEETAKLLGTTLVTEQTTSAGEDVKSVYIEAAVDIVESYFFAIAIDPKTGSLVLLASQDGGADFEHRAQTEPSTVKMLHFAPESPGSLSELFDFLSQIGIESSDAAQSLYSARQAFVENDMTLLEINPFAKTRDGRWMAIDAKISLDSNALFRRPEFGSMVSDQNLRATEFEAQRNNINLVKLEGDIGVVANGAGLGLATNDMIVDAGGQPANFMDIRTTATSFDIAKGVELLLKDPQVSVILLNVHGGGMTSSDTVAEGINFAYSRSDRKLPVIAHLSGQNAEWGIRILQDRKVPVEVFETSTDAIARVVEIAKK